MMCTMGMVKTEHDEDAVHSMADDVQKHSKFPVGKEFWKENSQPKSLLPIKTIIDTIHFPVQTYNQQEPRLLPSRQVT